MLCEIELHYGANESLKKASAELYAKLYDGLRQEMPSVDWPKPEDQAAGEKIYVYGSSRLLVDMASAGPLLCALDIKFEVKRFKGNYWANGAPQRDATGAVTNTHISVHIPNIDLLSVDEIILCEDACTDAVRRHLDDGFRILAICPPASQRRPDYILGRTAAMRGARDKEG